MRDFQAAATRLAYRRQQFRTQHHDRLTTAEEAALLQEVGATRHAVQRSFAG